MHKRNIIFINRFFYPDHSATSQLLSDLAFYLAEKELNITVICSRQIYDNSMGLQPAREKVNGVNVYRVRTSNYGRQWLPGRAIDYITYFLGMIWCLFKLVKSDDIIIAKTDPPLTSVLTIIVAKLKGAKQINWVQDLFPEVAMAVSGKKIPNFIFNIIKNVRNLSFRYSEETVVIGEVMKDKLLKQGLDQNVLSIIHNWSDASKVIPIDVSNNPLIESWQLKGKFIVGYSGNMGRVHEFDTILNAAAALKDNPEVLFVFIGGGPQKAYVQSKINELGLNNVRFFPYQAYDELSNSLSLPDVHLISLKPEIEGYCVPSKYFGILAAGRASIFIGDDQGQIASMIKEDQTGEVVKVGDYQDLMTKICDMYKNKPQIDEFGNNARNSLNTKYDKKIALNAWLELIQSQS